MDTLISILGLFFKMPSEGFHIREVARITQINHTTVRQFLNRFEKEGILQKVQSKPYPLFISNEKSKKYLNLKLFYNLEKLRMSNLIEALEKEYDLPVIILFGSYAKALDDHDSDIDICIITDIKKRFDRKSFEKILERHISLHFYTENEFKNATVSNPDLINSICNGLTLSGQIEVLR